MSGTYLRPAFPIPGTQVTDAYNYGESLWGKTAKLVVRLPTGENDNYFLKVWLIVEHHEKFGN